MTYMPTWVSRHFDAFGDNEWKRLEADLPGRNNYAVHAYHIDAHVHAGMRVLDIGSGPGRYAIDLVRLGADVTVADISAVQLELARTRLGERGLADRVRAFLQLDVTNLQDLDDESFDVVVCYGAVLSYTYDQHPRALAELWRVTRPGGIVLLSVMSLYGTLRMIASRDSAPLFADIDSQMDWPAVLSGSDIVLTRSNDQSRPPDSQFRPQIALFTSRGLRSAIEYTGFEVLALASANTILPKGARAPQLDANSEATEKLRTLELAVCDQPGLVDCGIHLIAVARRPPRNEPVDQPTPA